MNVSSTIRIAAVMAAMLLAPRAAWTATLTWDNGGGDKLWTTTTNWNPDGSPTGNDIVFATTGTAAAGTVTNDTDGSWTINTLNFLNTGSSAGAQTTRLAASQTVTVSGTGATAFNVGPTGVGVTNATPTHVVFNGGGALAVTGGTTATFGVATGTAGAQVVNTLDMSGLGSFSANVGSFVIANNARQAATVLLASATNSITATALTLGSNNSASSSNNGSFIGLGAANTISANTINIGNIRSSGTMAFQGSVSNGTVTIRDYAGTGPAALVMGNQTASATATSTGALDFSLGTVDARFSTVTLGQGAPATGAGGGVGTITLGPGSIVSGTINAGTAGSTSNAASTAVGTVNLLANSGTLSATSMVLGRQTNAQPSNGSGVVNQAGGVAAFGTLTFANYSAAGTGLVSGTYNLSGGTLRAATIQAGANSSSTGTSSRTFNWTGGTIQNFDAVTNLTIAGSNSFTLLLAGTGVKSFAADTGRTITVAAVLGGTSGFTKTGSGILALNGNATYTGSTTVSSGTLLVNGGMASSGVSVNLAAVLGGTGTIANGVSVNGILSPGTGVGLLTLGSLTLNASGTTVLDVVSAGARGVDYDAIDVTGLSGLTYGGNLNVAFGGSALPDNTVLNVFGFTGTPSSSFAGISSTGFFTGTWASIGGGNWQIASGAQTATFSESAGTITIVPEPTSAVALVAGLGLGTMVFRRRRQGAED